MSISAEQAIQLRQEEVKRYDPLISQLEECKKNYLAMGMKHQAEEVDVILEGLKSNIQKHIQGKRKINDQMVIDRVQHLASAANEVITLFHSAKLNEKRLRIAITKNLVTMLDDLDEKAVDLDNRKFLGEAESLASICGDLKSSVQRYQECEISLIQLQEEFDDRFYTSTVGFSEPKLYEHRTLAPLTKNILLAVGTLGVGYLAAGLIQLAHTKGKKFILFKEKKTVTAQKMEKVSEEAAKLKIPDPDPPKMK